MGDGEEGKRRGELVERVEDEKRGEKKVRTEMGGDKGDAEGREKTRHKRRQMHRVRGVAISGTVKKKKTDR